MDFMKKGLIIGGSAILALSLAAIFANKSTAPLQNDKRTSVESPQKAPISNNQGSFSEENQSGKITIPAEHLVKVSQEPATNPDSAANTDIDNNKKPTTPGTRESTAGTTPAKKKLLLIDPDTKLRARHAFEEEETDSAWAPQTEDTISSSLKTNDYANRYNIEELRCKTTMCIVKVSIDSSKTTPDFEDNFGWQYVTYNLPKSELGNNLTPEETAVYSDPDKPNILYYETTFSRKK